MAGSAALAARFARIARCIAAQIRQTCECWALLVNAVYASSAVLDHKGTGMGMTKEKFHAFFNAIRAEIESGSLFCLRSGLLAAHAFGRMLCLFVGGDFRPLELA